MSKKDYPMLWQRGLIQAQVRNRADHKCEGCGMKFHDGTNIAIDAIRSDGHPMVGTVHHIDENKQNCSMNNLVFLCQSCHWIIHIYDWKPGKELLLRWDDVPDWILKRNIPYKLHPQLPLWS